MDWGGKNYISKEGTYLVWNMIVSWPPGDIIINPHSFFLSHWEYRGLFPTSPCPTTSSFRTGRRNFVWKPAQLWNLSVVRSCQIGIRMPSHLFESQSWLLFSFNQRVSKQTWQEICSDRSPGPIVMGFGAVLLPLICALTSGVADHLW